MKNREIKLFPIGNALSKENPIESQWICRNKEFPAPVEINPMENPEKLPRYGISYTCKALSKQIPLKVNGFAKTRNSQHLRVV